MTIVDTLVQQGSLDAADAFFLSAASLFLFVIYLLQKKKKKKSNQTRFLFQTEFIHSSEGSQACTLLHNLRRRCRASAFPWHQTALCTWCHPHTNTGQSEHKEISRAISDVCFNPLNIRGKFIWRGPIALTHAGRLFTYVYPRKRISTVDNLQSYMHINIRRCTTLWLHLGFFVLSSLMFGPLNILESLIVFIPHAQGQGQHLGLIAGRNTQVSRAIKRFFFVCVYLGWGGIWMECPLWSPANCLIWAMCESGCQA